MSLPNRHNLIALALLLQFILCSGSIAKVDEAARAIAALDKKVAAWNRHDLNQVLNAYADSADLSIMSTGTDMFGKETLNSKYQKWYGKDHALMGKIGYSDLKTKMLDKRSALLTGRYTLDEPGEQPVKGVFTLVYLQTAQGWKIIHEHLSKSASAK